MPANSVVDQFIGMLATADPQVISPSENRGFSMLTGDYRTLAEQDLPGKLLVFNNGASGFVGLEQKSTGILDYGSGLKNPNFAAMAEAIGIHGIRPENPAGVDNGIAAALAREGPVLIDAVVNRTEFVMPPPVTLEMATGFTLYMVNTVISGRGDEVVDLATTILWR